jgi:hypothetical protein
MGISAYTEGRAIPGRHHAEGLMVQRPQWEIITKMNIQVFCDKPCQVIYSYWHFSGACCFRLKAHKVRVLFFYCTDRENEKQEAAPKHQYLHITQDLKIHLTLKWQPPNARGHEHVTNLFEHLFLLHVFPYLINLVCISVNFIYFIF